MYKICKNCNLNFEAKNNRFKLCGLCKITLQKAQSKLYKINNKNKVSDYNKKYKQVNRQNISEYNRQYNIDNREKIQTRQTIQHRERRQKDLRYKMTIVIRNRFRKFYKGMSNNTASVIGIEYTTYLSWLEFNFFEDMNWQNHGTVWHIDHLIPCYWFDHTKDTDTKICFNWINTRPIYRDLNLRRKTCSYRELLNQTQILWKRI